MISYSPDETRAQMQDADSLSFDKNSLKIKFAMSESSANLFEVENGKVYLNLPNSSENSNYATMNGVKVNFSKLPINLSRLTLDISGL